MDPLTPPFPRWALFVLSASFLLLGCDAPPVNTPPPKSTAEKAPLVERDLSDIREEGVLRAITVYSGTSYFLYRGQPMGFEYEMLERLANHLDLELEIVVAKDLDELFKVLNEGGADLVAYGMTITEDRLKRVAFTDYLYLTKQVLVQKKPENWRNMKLHEIQSVLVSDPIELIGDTVSVRKNSSYIERVDNLEEEIGGRIFIDTIPGNVPTEEIIQAVVKGDIEYTFADQNLADINASYFPILDVSTPVSFSQRIAWAVRKNAPELRSAINGWIREMKKEVDYYVIYNKYFKNQRSFKARVKSDLFSLKTGKISPYDEWIRTYTQGLPWDWRLVSSIVYQESQFDPKATSWANAQGLMQLMPMTAREMGVTDLTDPEQNLKGGIGYLKKLWEEWEVIPDSLERTKFMLASYNCGLGHVQDARHLAKLGKKDPNKWKSVRKELLNLTSPEYYNSPEVRYGYVHGIEPVTYVDQIFDRYEHYRTLVPD
jgi:membrane-bound lytic murein transglycosylase F